MPCQYFTGKQGGRVVYKQKRKLTIWELIIIFKVFGLGTLIFYPYDNGCIESFYCLHMEFELGAYN